MTSLLSYRQQLDAELAQHEANRRDWLVETLVQSILLLIFAVLLRLLLMTSLAHHTGWAVHHCATGGNLLGIGLLTLYFLGRFPRWFAIRHAIGETHRRLRIVLEIERRGTIRPV